MIFEFQAVDDRLAAGFRYPNVLERQFNVDLVNMRAVMGRVAAFLDSLVDYLGADISAGP